MKSQHNLFLLLSMCLLATGCNSSPKPPRYNPIGEHYFQQYYAGKELITVRPMLYWGFYKNGIIERKELVRTTHLDYINNFNQQSITVDENGEGFVAVIPQGSTLKIQKLIRTHKLPPTLKYQVVVTITEPNANVYRIDAYELFTKDKSFHIWDYTDTLWVHDRRFAKLIE